MLTLALTGQYSRKLFRGLSVGHVFILMLTYVVFWLLNLLGCSWIWLAGIEGKDNSWTQSIGQSLEPSIFLFVLQGYRGDVHPLTAKHQQSLEPSIVEELVFCHELYLLLMNDWRADGSNRLLAGLLCAFGRLVSPLVNH